MNDSTSAVIILILFMLLLLAIAYFGTSIMVKRAMKAVIKRFRDYQALSPEKAMTVQDLGLQSRSFFQFRGLRDYKPSALQFLMKNEIVLATEDGKLFLSEQALLQSDIEQRIGGGRNRL